MSSIRGRILVLLVLSPARVFAASAQQSPKAELRLDTPSFVFARYATASAASLYGARGFGPVGGFVGMVQNRKTQYRELIAGMYTQVNWDRQSVLVALGYADALRPSRAEPDPITGAWANSSHCACGLPFGSVLGWGVARGVG